MNKIDQLTSQAHMMGVTIIECPLPSGVCGVYYDMTRTIYLHDKLNNRQQLCTLQHELIHAKYHDMGCGNLFDTMAERRAIRETALSLINPFEYANVEQIYEGNTWHIASELGVTMQVIHDYQQLLAQKQNILVS